MRIAIVNDMALAVAALRRVVESVPGYRVAWTAADGTEAVRKCIAAPPDLVLMDLIMPEMDGATATAEIMRQAPCPILVVTASVQGNSEKVYEAMGYGALDAARTPTLGRSGNIDGAASLLRKIERIASMSGFAKRKMVPVADPAPPHTVSGDALPALAAIGASTGGPQALATLLACLPSDFKGCVTIVQHVDVDFAAGLAQWLSRQVSLPVTTITSGERPRPGTVKIAASDDHLILRPDGTFAYVNEPRDLVYRPSVDVFFHSLATLNGTKGIAALLTGMGRDGADGLLALRKAKWQTVAQDERSCVVYGMPKAAVAIEAAMHLLPPQAIGRLIAQQG